MGVFYLFDKGISSRLNGCRICVSSPGSGKAPNIVATAYTQVIKSSQMAGELLPKPPILGTKPFTVPSELKD